MNHLVLRYLFSKLPDNHHRVGIRLLDLDRHVEVINTSYALENPERIARLSTLIAMVRTGRRQGQFGKTCEWDIQFSWSKTLVKQRRSIARSQLKQESSFVTSTYVSKRVNLWSIFEPSIRSKQRGEAFASFDSEEQEESGR